jgi:hypothetical protein
MTIISKPSVWTKETTTEWVDGMLDSFFKGYQQDEQPQRVNFRTLCSDWAWAKRSDVYTHYLHRYPAKLLPYIPIYFLSSTLAGDGPILDPFAGTGTVAVEAIVHFTNPSDCKLVEINPLARLISSTKTTPINPESLKKESTALFNIIEKINAENTETPEFPGIDFWFREEAQKGLSIIRDSIELLETDVHIKDFFWVCFSSIIRDMSRADPKVSPPVRLSADKFQKGDYKDTLQKKIDQKNEYSAFVLFKNTVLKNIDRMRNLWDAWQLSGKHASVVGHDARNLTNAPYIGKGSLDILHETQMMDNSVGLVITSPPYINAQKYTRTTKFELWWLGLVESSSESLAQYDKALIGTERVIFDEYTKLIPVRNKTADTFIGTIYEIDKQKAAIVGKYFNDMRTSLQEIKRVLKPGGYCVLVVGNNIVNKQPIPNNIILAEIAKDEGLVPKAMLVDEIRSRGLITKRHDTAGMIADEWIILLQKPMLAK